MEGVISLRNNNLSNEVGSVSPNSHTVGSIILAIALASFSIVTVCGNTLVILAVALRPNLHGPTGYTILSLAVADLIVGLIVMPFNTAFELASRVWHFGLTFCDIWHSLDVLASTSSIWNLCVIALDRYLAVIDPLRYPDRMTPSRALWAVATVWIGSSLIAFPAIAWWRSVSPKMYLNEFSCLFTDDLGYLTFSSILSFYLPLLVIVGAYWKVYTVAKNYQKCLRKGRIRLPSNPEFQMRVHRGGTPTTTKATLQKTGSITSFQSEGIGTPIMDGSRKTSANSNIDIHRHQRAGLLQRLFTKESKAAQTLGVVVTCFVACWMPFFVVNILAGACPSRINKESLELTFTIVTWLGHCNSALNPLIYTFFNREFQLAFIWLLCYEKRRRRFTTKKGLALAIKGSLKVIVPQVSTPVTESEKSAWYK